jgi:hypothetical protein
MIRNGDLPIQLPSFVRSGDNISARTINQLITAIRRLSNRTPVDSSSGKGSKSSKSPFMPILKAVKGENDESGVPQFTYKIALSKGYVIERRIPDDQALIYHFPTELVDEDDNPIYHDITDGQAIYVKVLVKKDGTIEEEPSVLVAEDELAGAHYKPKIFDFDGADGEHNYKIAVFEIVDSKPRLKLYGAGDNIDHYDERVTMENLEAEGDCYEVGKTYNEAADKVEFRKLKQLSGEGSPVIKDQTDETINFKRIKARTSPSQINVTDDGDAIKIYGNNNMGSLTHVTCEGASTVILEWDDGLITSPSKSFTAGCTGSGSGGGGGMP